MALSFTGQFPLSFGAFTTAFVQPQIPNVTTEIRGHFLQHKWDYEVSHIVSGYWYNSAANGKVRVDETYDGAYGSSLFDYTQMTPEGSVRNHQIIVPISIGAEPSCFDDYVSNPGFPLITSDFLQSYNATFGGVVQEPFLGVAQTWNLLIADSISVIAYLDPNNVLMGFDFWGEERRTKVLTRFFAQQVGEIDAEVFEDFVCPG